MSRISVWAATAALSNPLHYTHTRCKQTTQDSETNTITSPIPKNHHSCNTLDHFCNAPHRTLLQVPATKAPSTCAYVDDARLWLTESEHPPEVLQQLFAEARRYAFLVTSQHIVACPNWAAGCTEHALAQRGPVDACAVPTRQTHSVVVHAHGSRSHEQHAAHACGPQREAG